MAPRDDFDALRAERALVVLRGPTGSGKTLVLRALSARAVQTLDLEALAGHRGSAFGGLGLPDQPSHAEFQRGIAAAWRGFDPARVVVCEDEGAYLGRVGVPVPLQRRLAAAPWVDLVVPFDRRVERTVAAYAGVAREDLVAAIRRVAPRLGAAVAARAIAQIDADELRDAAAALLAYYDRAYAIHRARVAHPPLATIDASDGAAAAGDILRLTLS